MKTKSKINVPLLREIQRHIAEAPTQFDMHRWFHSGSDIPNCGTAACIAGWAVASTHDWKPARAARRAGDVAELARTLLGLTDGQCGRLFYMGEWPERFWFNDYASPEWRASRGVARIEHFIKTRGAA